MKLTPEQREVVSKRLDAGAELGEFTIQEIAWISSTPFSWRCVDCSLDTWPGNDGLEPVKAMQEGRGYTRHYMPGASEVYTVWAEVWKASGIDDHGGCLCIACLEKRIGRRLEPWDFNEKGMQAPGPEYCTPLLASRRFNLTRQERRALRAAARWSRKRDAA